MKKIKWLSIITVLLFAFVFLASAQETDKEKIRVKIEGLENLEKALAQHYSAL